MIDFPRLNEFPVFALDTETTGLQWFRDDKVYGFSISTPDGKDFYWDVRKTPKALDWLRDQTKQYEGRIINHKIKFDGHMLMREGIDIGTCKIDCTEVRAALIDEHRLTYNLDDVARDCIGERKLDVYGELAEIFGGKPTRRAQILNLQRPEAAHLVDKYAKRDTRVALKLWEWQNEQIAKVDPHGNSLERINALEREVWYVIQDLEWQGVRVDVERAEKSQFEIDQKVDKMQIELNKLAGFEVNPNPSGSIHKLFAPDNYGTEEKPEWETKCGVRLETTGAGNASINADALRRIKHPTAKMILDIRKLKKASGTFLEKHILERQVNGRVFPNINQCKGDDGGTLYGRLSYTEPALQQIPSRDKDIAGIVRPIFLPEDGQEWYKMDYEQADARAFVHYTKSPPLVEAYNNDPFTDFHGLTASLTGISRNPKFSGDPNSKQLGLGLLFNMGEGTMASEMGLPFTTEIGRGGKEFLKPGHEAQAVFDRFHEAVPGVKEFSQKATSVARSRGYVMSVMGRFLRFPRGMFVYKSSGYLYASCTSEANKTKMVALHKILKGTGSRIILSVHDELNQSSDDPGLMVKTRMAMEDFHSDQAHFHLDIPMRVDVKKGLNWFDVKKVERGIDHNLGKYKGD